MFGVMKIGCLLWWGKAPSDSGLNALPDILQQALASKLLPTSTILGFRAPQGARNLAHGLPISSPDFHTVIQNLFTTYELLTFSFSVSSPELVCFRLRKQPQSVMAARMSESRTNSEATGT